MNGERERLRYYRLLCLLEDYLRDGFRGQHLEAQHWPDAAPARAPAPAATASAGAPATAPARPAASAGAPAAAPARPAASAGAPAAAGPGPRESAAPSGAPPGAAGADSLERVAAQVKGCTLCGLAAGRTHAVPGEGAAHPLVLVVGEGPGAEEDRSGRPFVGPAGRYLDKWLEAIGLDRRRNCFIANAVKCRPPGNRDPEPGESAACLPYLARQIALLQPRVILTVGRIATQILTDQSAGVGQLRGRQHSYRGLPLIATYHPSAVLRAPELRRAVWEDLKRLRALLDHG